MTISSGSGEPEQLAINKITFNNDVTITSSYTLLVVNTLQCLAIGLLMGVICIVLNYYQLL